MVKVCHVALELDDGLLLERLLQDSLKLFVVLGEALECR